MLRQSLHALLRRPLLSAGIVATLGLALAATLLVLGLLDRYLLRPLPYGDADRLVAVLEYPLSAGPSANTIRLAFGNAADVHDRVGAFARTAIVRNESFTVHTPGGSEVAFLQRVTPEFFPLFGLRALHGEFIHPGNAELGGERAIVLAYDFWTRRYGGDPRAVGQSIRLDDHSYRIVGVAPANLTLPLVGEGQQGWVAMLPSDFVRGDRVVRRHFMFGELAPGRTLGSAQGELAALTRTLARDFPATNADRGLTAITLREALVGSFRQQLVLLQAAVGLVLVVACVNAGSLLLAQAIRRRREFAVRLALGAGTRDLARQFFLESLLLSLGGALLGLLLAAWIAPLTRALLPANSTLGQLPPPTLSPLVAVGALVLAAGIAVLFTLVPLWQARRLNLEATLRDGARQAGSVGAGRAMRGLVTLQVAVALALSITAIQLVRSFQAVQQVDRGLPVEQIVGARIGTRGAKYQSREARAQFFDAVAAQLEQLPHVAAVGFQDWGYVTPGAGYFNFVQEGDGLTTSESPKRAARYFSSVGMRDAWQLRLLSGRWLTPDDRANTTRVAVISESLAAKHWPGRDPIGQRVRLENTDEGWWTIVGVVSNVLSHGAQPQPIDAFYLPYVQGGLFDVAFSVRLRGTQPFTKDELDRAINAVDPINSSYLFLPAAKFYADSAWQTRFGLTLVVSFATLAVVLCLTGVYAVLAFAVANRTAEFGVRLALGATPGAVARLVLADALRMTLPGLLLGALLAVQAARLVAHLLYGVSTVDPLSHGAALLALAAACTAACLVPARRAAKVDPLVALRAE
ncbi:ADOP family duplicated permease [Oleiharenicola sp. Vm1]|uniref:ADOP family duplicated permease n=1 Tax=Oleiharenicola sp. Vm1 TaxID=3398393 RepID=UPI0039F4A07D